MGDVIVETANAVCRVELNRASCGNLVTMDMVKSLIQALQTIAPDVKLLVLAGQGADFCRGRDYQDAPESAKAGSAAPSALKIRKEMTGPIVTLYTALRDISVPSLSIVQGSAYGFGCALAGACDMCIAAEDARFRLPEMGRGLPPTLAMSALWERVPSRALGYMVYSTAELDAREAHEIGLASVVSPVTELKARAGTLVERVCNEPLDAVKAVKEYLKQAPSMHSAARTAFGASVFAEVLSSR
jgi:enoyl-CoA hydratase/carnithine racemase